MADREKIIRAVETCFDSWIDKHGYTGLGLHAVEGMKRDALELLKEQEPVRPVKQIEQTEWTVCGNCHNHIISKWMFCPYCGKAVKWDG